MYFSNFFKTRSYLNYTFIALLLFFGSIKNSCAAVIEPYDFGDVTPKVTKVWSQDVALYVAKRFAAENGLNAKDVSVKKLNAGATNHFIYLIFIDNQMKFVLKGLGTQNEAEALYNLQHYSKIPEIQNNPGAATITLSKLINSYKVSNDGKTYYFAILEAAQGKELFKIMTAELIEHKDLNSLKNIFYHIGQQTSELHKTIVGTERFTTPRNLVSVIHDDLHPENTFYDGETNHFSLIDNESMGDSITNPMPLIRELYGFYEVPIIRWPSEKITIDLLKDADPHDIAAIYHEYILGAASVYQNAEEAKKILTEVIIRLNDMSIAFLKDRYSEPWMYNPTDKSEAHIVWGKFSKVAYNPELAKLYITHLTIIKNELKALSGI
ncbi:serine kinase [Legionella sp. km772]|uniref:serine kinase n=1 Tax=Legionella sp. km772 TaxID=2498111 RepID=UPI000F8E90DA|nr:serine kinase [Legionella sp. km772]RUR12495.1 serine kinase [Legionella sp. km772]